MRQETAPVIRMVNRPFLKPANEEGLNQHLQFAVDQLVPIPKFFKPKSFMEDQNIGRVHLLF